MPIAKQLRTVEVNIQMQVLAHLPSSGERKSSCTVNTTQELLSKFFIIEHFMTSAVLADFVLFTTEQYLSSTSFEKNKIAKEDVTIFLMD